MCIGLEVVGMLFSAAKTVVGYIGAQNEAKAAQRAANQQAALLERQAREVEDQKQEELKIARRDARLRQADAEAKTAANGLDVSGQTSSSLLLADHALIREEDAKQIDLEGERRKRNLREEANIKRAEGSAAASAGRINATGSLISGGATIADRWLRSA